MRKTLQKFPRIANSKSAKIINYNIESVKGDFSIEANYKLGRLNITPSFTPGLYAKGDGKDLGSVIEFKSDVQLSYDVDENTNLGMSYNHVSNASLGDKNPGANSYMFNLLRKF